MAERDPGARRGLFRRAPRVDTPEANPTDNPTPRRERRSTGEMFTPRQPAVEDPWSSDAWADDGWNDAWDDRSRRASIRPAAAPRSAAVDAWLESDQVEFADVTADIARKWVPDPGGGRGVTWDEPEPAVDGRGSQAPQVSDSQPAQPATDVSGAASARHVVEPVTASIPEFVSEPVVKHISDAVSEPVAEQVP